MRERRLAFGQVAERYDQARPSYPSELIDDVLALAPLDGGGSGTLEVGAGTGKATVLFAARGVSVLALEPSVEMAGIAEHNCAAYPHVVIEQTEFERWQQPVERFPLLYSAQAWHWIAPEARYPKAHAALVPGGLLAAFWNRPDWERCSLREEIDDVYARAAPSLEAGGPMRPGRSGSADVWGDWCRQIDGAPGFARPEVRTYRWAWSYTSEQYARLLSTHSDHIVLDAGQQAVLYQGIMDVIDAAGGVLALTYVTRLCLAWAM